MLHTDWSFLTPKPNHQHNATHEGGDFFAFVGCETATAKFSLPLATLGSSNSSE